MAILKFNKPKTLLLASRPCLTRLAIITLSLWIKQFDSGRAIRRAKRVGVLAVVVMLALTGASWKRLIVTKDRSIPKLIAPLTDAKFDDLTRQLSPSPISNRCARRVLALFLWTRG